MTHALFTLFEGHYHLGAGSGQLSEPLAKVHLPAPNVGLDSFLTMVIVEFGFLPFETTGGPS